MNKKKKQEVVHSLVNVKIVAVEAVSQVAPQDLLNSSPPPSAVAPVV